MYGRRGPSGAVEGEAGASTPSLWGLTTGRMVLNVLTATLFSHQLLQLRETIPYKKPAAVGLVTVVFVILINMLFLLHRRLFCIYFFYLLLPAQVL